MAQRMQSNPWSRGAASLGAALFPDGRTVAAGKIAGQQLSELAARTEKTQAETYGINDQNTALGDAVLEAAGLDPAARALIRAGRGNAAQLADAYETTNRVGTDRAAGDAFEAGNYQGAGANQLRGGRTPIATNAIDEGYQLNPYATGGDITPTGETLADIAATGALRRQRDASAAYDNERTRNPERFRAPSRAPAGPKPVTISPGETSSIANEAARLVPGASAQDLMLVTARASELVTGGANPASALSQAATELFETVPEQTLGGDDWIPFNEQTIPGGTRRRMNVIDPTDPASMNIRPPAQAQAASGGSPLDRLPPASRAAAQRIISDQSLTTAQKRAALLQLDGVNE